MIVFVLLTVAMAETGCRELRCKSIDVGLCTSITSEAYYAQPCLGDRNCDFISMLMPYLNETNMNISCLPNYKMNRVLTFEGLVNSIDSACGNLSYYKSAPRLLNQSLPAECNEDTDCRLSNGLYTACNCGLDGKKYCKFGEGDDVYLTFAEAACVKNWSTFLSYANILLFQAHALTYPSCAGQIYADFSWSEYMKDGGDAYRLFATRAFANTLHSALVVALVTYL